MTAKVLIVEDNDIVRLVETKLVKQCHCDVDTAISGEQALDLITHEHYDLVLMDIGLPDTTGLELAKKIRSDGGDNKTVPIVALTAHDNDITQENAILAGMNSFIVKPLTAEKCQEVLKNFVTINI